MTPPIADLKAYTADMRSSLDDKLFFWDRLGGQVDVWVDFGCADGALLAAIRERNPGAFLYGYDTNRDMLDLAAASLPSATFTSTWGNIEKAVKRVKQYDLKVGIVFSSVIHEVLNEEGFEWDAWWSDITGLGADYIVVRDMAVRYLAFNRPHPYFPRGLVRGSLWYRMWNEGEHPAIWTERDAIHFLLKYRYQDNWERELEEDYLPLPAEVLRSYLNQSPLYEETFFEHFTLPFLAESVYQDFGIRLTEPTHVKLILEAK